MHADGTASSCAAGRFNWIYNVDETIYVIEGGVIIKDVGGAPRRYQFSKRLVGNGGGADVAPAAPQYWRCFLSVRKARRQTVYQSSGARCFRR